MMSTGEKIRVKREALGYSRPQLAEQSGVSLSAITQYELGKRSPQVEMLKRLAQTMNCSVDELIGD